MNNEDANGPAETDSQFPHAEVEEVGIAALSSRMRSGSITAQHLMDMYVQRVEAIDQSGPTLRSVLELNPDAHETAAHLDRERERGADRGILHGIPVLLKDNIATLDNMNTTAGSMAMLGSKMLRDAFVAKQLRDKGAILLGKANMSEWANFRSPKSTSGWSGRGGQTLNPYALDSNPSGSSSGSAVAVAANLVAAALGTETDGSILAPASVNGIVGIKPTVGLTSRSGVIPLAHSQDSVGPLARTVQDAAIVLEAIAGPDPRDPASMQPRSPHVAYTSCLDPDGLRGARIGVPRDVYWGYSSHADRIAEQAIETMRSRGATIIDPADIPTARQMSAGWPPQDNSALTVMLYELKADLNAFLADLGSDAPVRSIEDVILYNERHAEDEMPYFGQEFLLMAQAKGPLTEQAYVDALARNRRLSRAEGIDAVMDEHQLDALVMPTTSPAWKIDLVNGGGSRGNSARPAALAGYPAISVPAGEAFGLPVGVTFVGRAWSEPTLLKLAYAYEQATSHRRRPEFHIPTVYPRSAGTAEPTPDNLR